MPYQYFQASSISVLNNALFASPKNPSPAAIKWSWKQFQAWNHAKQEDGSSQWFTVHMSKKLERREKGSWGDGKYVPLITQYPAGYPQTVFYISYFNHKKYIFNSIFYLRVFKMKTFIRTLYFFVYYIKKLKIWSHHVI